MTIEHDVFSLKNKVAIVTGSGRGLGKDIAMSFSNFGADIVLIARNKNEIEEVKRLIESNGSNCLSIQADITNVTNIKDIVSSIISYTGKIDILVNNAGTNIPQETLEVTEEAWDSIMNINLKAAFFLSQEVAKVMINSGSEGRIINISSQTGTIALAKRAAYCASKAGLNLITKIMAVDLGKYNIQVNAIAPTFIETDLTKRFLSDTKFREYAMSKNVLNRFGKPEDVSAAALYLASSASNIVTGEVLHLDAGWTAH